MAKRKSNFHIEQELIKKFKTNPCSVNMTLFNPALWIYNYTIDVTKKRNNKMNSESIKRVMNKYANSKKPLIPISYIDRRDIYRVIDQTWQFRKFTNIEELIGDQQQEKRLNKYAKSIFKRLNESEFRQTDLFKKIKINSELLFETMLLLNSNFDDLLPTDVNTERAVEKINGKNSLEAVDIENNADFENILSNCRSQQEFVECTNVKQLAKIQIRKRGLGKISGSNKKALIEIIINNTWKQLEDISKVRRTQCFDEIVDQFNSNSLLHRYVIDRLRDGNYDENDSSELIRIKAFYSNCDKCLVPVTYLKNSEILQIFPNLFIFIKFTNILKPFRNRYRSLRDDIIKRNMVPIQCMKTNAYRVYQILINDPNFSKIEACQEILINCKFLFNQIGIPSEEDGDIVHEIIEYFKRLDPHESPKKQVNLNSSSESNNGMIRPISQQNRRRAKMLNQVQAKLNTNAVLSEEDIAGSDINSSLESNVTVINCHLENNQSSADQQEIVVSEFNTEQIEFEMYAIHGTENTSCGTRSVHTQYPVAESASRINGSPKKTNREEFSQGSIPKMLSPSIACSIKLEMFDRDGNENLTFTNSSYSSSVEFVGNVIEEPITIENSPTKSQRIAAILHSSLTNLTEVSENSYAVDVANPYNINEVLRKNCINGQDSVINSTCMTPFANPNKSVANKIDEVITIDDSPINSQRIVADLELSQANLSEISHISYSEVIANRNNIIEMRKQNCKKKISKNPELEIPVMRNKYRPLPAKKKKLN